MNEPGQDIPTVEQPAPATAEPLEFDIKLKDKADDPLSFDMLATVSDPTAVDRPPTPAMIVGTFIVAHLDQIVLEATAWASQQKGPSNGN